MDLNTHATVLNNAAVSIAVEDKALRATDLVFQARGHTLKQTCYKATGDCAVTKTDTW
jgi:hypothetical protein